MYDYDYLLVALYIWQNETERVVDPRGSGWRILSGIGKCIGISSLGSHQPILPLLSMRPTIGPAAPRIRTAERKSSDLIG